MKVQLPVGTGPIKSSRKYKTMTDNQKMIYDKVYDKTNGILFFAENCAYVNRNGIKHYKPFDYQREMLFNMHNYDNVISLFSRQNGKCFCPNMDIKIRNKKTKKQEVISIGDFYKLIQNNKK